jgi:hypothetical protein
MIDADDSLEMIFQSPDPVRVQMARDLLAESGIESFIFDSEAARMLGGTVAIEPRLMVRADCAAEARERLAELGFTRE